MAPLLSTMKLNKRVSLLILPVLIIGYLIAVLGVYHTQKASVVALEKRTIDLQATELSSILKQYTNVAESFMEALLYNNSLHNYFSSRDKVFKALSLEKGLENSIKDSNALSSDYFSVALIRSGGSVEYYYENSFNPFSEISDYHVLKAHEAFQERQSEWTQVYEEQGSSRIILIRIIDQNTFKPPVAFADESNIAIVVAVEPTLFNKKMADHLSKGLLVQWSEKQNASSGNHQDEGFLTAYANGSYGTLSVSMPDELLQKKLDKLRLSLLISFIVITLVSYITLIFLINRYVTGPIRKLEHDLFSVCEDENTGFVASESQDEIGGLSRTFSQLYDSLDQSYRLTKELAEKDTLTKLYNRRMFQNAVDKMISRAEYEEVKAALFYIDIDNFKFVNDTYGHSMGDILLQAFSERLNAVVRGTDKIISHCDLSDTSARLAGDEFAVIISGLTDDMDANSLAGRILNICSDGFACEQGVFPVSLSIGVAIFPSDGANTEALINNADAAMYEAKIAGKNRISFYSQDLAAKSRRKYAIDLELTHLNMSELELLYRPVFNTEARESICSIETLISWNSPSLGKVSPSEFIPIAESNGQYEKIDTWVIERAFMDFTRINQHFKNDVHVSIKISSMQLTSKSFIKTLSTLIDRYQIVPKFFEFEIAEAFNTDRKSVDIRLLFLLKDLGFRLALVDFGTGFTSIMQLVEYPIDIVTLDKTFTANLLDETRREKLLSLLDFCRSQGFDITAKGVESEEQAAVLKAVGCGRLQGDYYAKPMPISALLAQF